MWLRLSCSLCLDIYHPLTRQPVMRDAEKGEPTDFSCFSKTRSLIKFCGLIWKEGGVLKATCLSLLAGMARRKLSCVCPLVAQSRCPNQFPQHFLLSTPHQRFKTLIVKKFEEEKTIFMTFRWKRHNNLRYNTVVIFDMKPMIKITFLWLLNSDIKFKKK